jgi:hypothetical protein
MTTRRHTHVKNNREASKVRRYWWLAPVLLVVAFIGWVATGPEWSRPRTGNPTVPDLPPGYVSAYATVVQEYQRFEGHPLQDKELGGRFDSATQLMKQHDYGAAADALEEVAKKAAVPAVFNDLGLVYLALNDRGHAVNSFREALSRDIDYPQVRQNLERLKEIGFENATPLTQEIEPNNTLLLANIIAPDKVVEGEIMPAVGDIDCYKVTTPKAPRDLLRVEVTPRTPTLAPMLKVYDGERRMLEFVQGKNAPGKMVSWSFSPAPNSTVYLEIWGADDTAGLYTVKLTALKAFDSYEPNDDIFNASPISLGTDVAAGLMDKTDTDYYSFEAAAAGKVRVTVRCKSAGLIPALSTFGPDMRSTGFGPDVRVPGGSLEHSVAVEAGKKYFLQVWGQGGSSGAYTLRVEQ